MSLQLSAKRGQNGLAVILTVLNQLLGTQLSCWNNYKLNAQRKKKHRSMSTIQDLTIQLYSYRRKWIQESTPLTVDIKKQYPSLKLRKVVCIFRCLCFILLLSTCIPSLYVQFRTEFKTIVGLPDDVGVFSLMESWPTWKERIIKYSQSRKDT